MEEPPSPVAELLAQSDGQRTIGAFQLTRQLGHGGFAPVWLAQEVYGEIALRTVAVKLFSLVLDAREERPHGARVILAEARTLCQVEHPNIVRFHSIAVDVERGVMGLVMEHVAGVALDRVLGERGRLPIEEAVEVGIAVASALAAAHRAGIVHRDVKPANIIHAASGYKLIDFGVARAQPGSGAEPSSQRANDVLLEQDAGGRTRPRTNGDTLRVTVATGTLGYVDPECLARGVPATASSDLYSLGATLFELVTGKLPACSGDVLLGAILDGRAQPPSLDALVPAVPRELAELVDSLLVPARSERPHSAAWVATRLQGVRRALAGRSTRVPPESLGPFRGLARFEASDQGVYFGRDLEVAQALQVLRVRGVLALLGPSGSGKSSLARAGVLPAVVEGQLGSWPETWVSAVATPGGDPAVAVFKALQPLLGPLDACGPLDLLALLLEHVQATGKGVVLLVDQLEELATVSDPKGRDFIVEWLFALSEQPLPGVRAVVTARRDLLDPLLALPGLGRALLPNAVLVEPLPAHAWPDALDQALSAYGFAWEDTALRDAIASEIARTASAMPLVQFALSKLWEERDTGRRILTRQAYERMGGISGALAQHAEATLAALNHEIPAGAQDAARRALLSLTTAQGTRLTREREEIERAGGAGAARVIEAFEAARLVVRLPNGYTLAHEALLGEWRRLAGWVADARNARLLVEEFEHDAARFAADAEAVPVWRKRRLLLVLDALAREALELGPRARGFLESGLRAERKRRLALTIALTALVVVVTGAAGTYLLAVRHEQARTRDALARERESRAVAETRTREVQRAQQRIDELLRGVAASPEKTEVLELQARIRGTEGPTSPKPLAAAPRVREAAERPGEPRTPPSAAPAAAPSMRLQVDW
ncbi:MAG TPA: serine/threonine-protein kinase [Polyangiaceae bacterium]